MKRCSRISSIVAAVCFLTGFGAAGADLSFRDDFVGATLNPAFRILNVDKDRYALTEDDYLLLLTHSDTKNTLQYVKELPEDFSVTIRVEEPPLYKDQVFRVRIGELDRNVRLSMFVSADGRRQSSAVSLIRDPAEQDGSVGFMSVKTIDSEHTDSITAAADLRGKPFYLRVTKRGVEYDMAYSENGSRWASVGKQVMINMKPVIFFETFNASTAPESPVKIDAFEVIDISR